MIASREVVVLTAPVAVAAVVAVALGLVLGPVHWQAAAAAVGLCVPVTFGTFVLARRMTDRHPFGGLIGMMIGVVTRMAVVVCGGALVFLGTGVFRDAPLAFWGWVLAAYLSSLVAETALLAGPVLRPVGGVCGGKG